MLDPEIVLGYFQDLPPNEELSLQLLSEKMITLLALSTAHRLQTFSLIQINKIQQQTSKIEIPVPDRIKSSRPGGHQPLLSLSFLNERVKICVADTLLIYLTKTKDIRAKEKRLFITVKKSHQAASSQTLARWIKSCLEKAGVNTKNSSAYSTKHAAVSASSLKGIDIDTIQRTAGWSKKSDVFTRFYNRPISSDQSTFAKSVLHSIHILIVFSSFKFSFYRKINAGS